MKRQPDASDRLLAEPDGPGQIVSGPSFPRTTKLIATVVVGALGACCARLWPELQSHEWEPPALLFAALVAGIVAIGYWNVLTSTTSIDARALRQRSLWSREVVLTDITQIKLVRLAGLDAIVVPRLLVRTRGGGVNLFTAGDARLVDMFLRLVRPRHVGH